MLLPAILAGAPLAALEMARREAGREAQLLNAVSWAGCFGGKVGTGKKVSVGCILCYA